MAFYHETQITEKEQIALLQNKVGCLSSYVHLEYRHIEKIETLVKLLCLGFILIFSLIVYLIILHVS